MDLVSGGCCAHMSKGYTIALAITAPVAPATADPHGGRGAGVWPGMWLVLSCFHFGLAVESQ